MITETIYIYKLIPPSFIIAKYNHNNITIFTWKSFIIVVFLSRSLPPSRSTISDDWMEYDQQQRPKQALFFTCAPVLGFMMIVIMSLTRDYVHSGIVVFCQQKCRRGRWVHTQLTKGKSMVGIACHPSLTCCGTGLVRRSIGGVKLLADS